MEKSPSPGKRLLGWTFTAIWLLVSLAYLAFFLIDMRLDFHQIRVPCEGPDCNYLAISPAEAAVLESWGLSTEVYAGFVLTGTILDVLVYLLLGFLILWRLGTTRIGWTVSLALVAMPVTLISDSDNVAANYPQLIVPAAVLSILGVFILLIFLYLLPNGRFYPRWAGVVLVVTIPIAVGTFQSYSGVFDIPPGVAAALEAFFLGLIAVPPVFQVFRYLQVSTPVERQQTKWILLGLVGFLASFPLWLLLFEDRLAIPSGAPRVLASLVGSIALNVLISLLPVTIALAILRYRLWDIDLIVRRTLIYGALTALLALLYFTGVTVVQALFSTFSQNQSQAAIVISTLAVAALFNPLRLRLQAAIDRRFFRARYDAERSLARFAAAARDEVDVKRLAGALHGVVEETIRPVTKSLWLK